MHGYMGYGGYTTPPPTPPPSPTNMGNFEASADDIILQYRSSGVVTVAMKKWFTYITRSVDDVYLRVPTFGMHQVTFAGLVVDSIREEFEDGFDLTEAFVPDLARLAKDAKRSITESTFLVILKYYPDEGEYHATDNS